MAKHYIYCISPAVPTLLSTYFTIKVLVLGDLPSENRNSSFPFPKSFMFPLHPGNKPSVMQTWSCVLCFTLSPVRLEPVSHSSGFSIQVSLPGNLTALEQSTFLYKVTGRGSKGIFHGIWSSPSWGVLITLESRSVHHQHRTKPGGNIPASSPSPQLSVAVTKPGDWESVTPCAPMPGYVWYDISSQLDPAITVESRQPKAVHCTNDNTSSLFVWIMWYRDQVLLGASTFLLLL